MELKVSLSYIKEVIFIKKVVENKLLRLNIECVQLPVFIPYQYIETFFCSLHACALSKSSAATIQPSFPLKLGSP